MSNAVKMQHSLQSREEAIQLANEINRMEAALKQMKDELKAYVKEQGEVDTGEEVWAYYDSVSWQFNSSNLKQVAREMAMEGTDPWSMLSLTKANINKLGWDEQRLSQLGTKKVTQRFTSRKN